MGAEGKAIGDHLGEIARALIDVKCLAACVAAEMVVVPLAREFVPGGLAGQFYGHDFPEFLQRTDRAVNSCHAELWDNLPRALEDFLWHQRVALLMEEGPDGFALFGLAFHRTSIARNR